MKFLNLSLVALSLIVSASAFSAQKSPARLAAFCDVKRQGDVILWEKVLASEFFSKVSQASRAGFPSRCMVGKIF